MSKMYGVAAVAAVGLGLTLFAFAAPSKQIIETQSCASAKELSALTMARIYSIKPEVVGVSIVSARKWVTTEFINIETRTHTAEASCSMVWISEDPNKCMDRLSDLECKGFSSNLNFH
jgi:hypothetical protein